MTRRTACALAAIAILLALLLVPPIPGYTRWTQTLHNFAHGPIFGAIAVLCMVALGDVPRLCRSQALKYASALLAAAILGAATELLQIPIARDASLGDFANDVLGAVAGLGAFAASERSFATRVRLRGAAVALVIFGVLVAPLTIATAAYARRHVAFPVVADFSRRLDTFFIAPQWATLERVRLPEPWAEAPGEYAARLQFEEGPWPGLDFHEPAPDWRGYSALALDITNPTDEPLDLSLRVHDVTHDHRHEDRFNRPLQVPPRTRITLRIPMEDIEQGPEHRLLDLQRIAGLLIFRSNRSQAAEMYVSRVWLAER